ncbi:DHH family phosphoesterase [Singulisphaera sp. PoT]|uniref:DHH family phosphoesterase n=1 Tax=Singulisphaera sp. PoT TaxID=3411797 RepID=UPI003BF58F25
MTAETKPEPNHVRQFRSERLLATLASFSRVVIVSHVNPDPDALASMLGLQAMIEQMQPGKPVVLTFDGMIARAENRAMVELLSIPIVAVNEVPIDPTTAVIMVDSQPYTGRRASEDAMPQVVIDHHETGGVLTGVLFRDLRPHVGATSTMVTGYLLEQNIGVTPRVATALLYGIESETEGYPRESSSLDDGALVWLFPRADKDLLAQIRNPKLPQSHFATFQHALANAFIYRDVVVSWCGEVTQPDIIAELADFFVRFDQVNWSVTIGRFENLLKLSLRVSLLGGHSGEVLREVIEGLGNAGGHDKRAGGAIVLHDTSPEAIDGLLTTIRHRLLLRLGIDEHQGRRLLEASPVIPAP